MEKYFKYRFIIKHLGGIISCVLFLGGTSFSIYATCVNEGNILLGLSIIWSILAILILLCVLTEIRNNVIFSPVIISNDGITTQIRNEKNNVFPKKNIKFVSWDSISHFEYFDNNDHDAIDSLGIKGIRLYFKDQKIVIYEHIKEYQTLVNQIKDKVKKADKK